MRYASTLAIAALATVTRLPSNDLFCGMANHQDQFEWARRIALVVMLCVASTACCDAPDSSESEDFFSKTTQTARERVVESTLVPVDSFPLSRYDAFDVSDIAVDDDWIYTADSKMGKVLAVDKEDFTSYRLIGLGPGEGPGETSGLRGLDISDEHIILANRPHRLARFAKKGSFIDELTIDHRPRRFWVTEAGKVVTYDPTSAPHLFMVLDRNGAVQNAIVDMRDVFDEFGAGATLRFSGFADFHNGHIYFSGYSESLFKKYSLDGTLIFSVATIDNHSSEDSYTETVMGEMRILSYTDTALYSSRNLEAYGRYCLIQPVLDDDGTILPYLDVYDAANGEYVRSYRVSRPPVEYVADAEHLYMLQADRNPETGESDRYVKIYDNVLRER